MIPEEFGFGRLDKELPLEWSGHCPIVSGPKKGKGGKKEEFTLSGLTSVCFLTWDPGNPGVLVTGLSS